ncbi:NUDIX domain-containing protein [Sulfitobacter aestuariivivens]|uniref:NUDIX domain-containing protein n=1 Tax=Sulfitobacter aestuariivivens TaxID=2766981 RepID=A0A927HEX8_9RHOB|nr:NUDIX domain-containing protein [Sulfitobacter aestuariivivens]MBD3664346.1 NUDIX domain-containing protein [Sulfitobacter aestuariivivens]
MGRKPPRIAVRAILVHAQKLLMVNAYADGRLGLMCAPGGGVEPGASLPDNLQREIHEETGLRVTVGAPCLVNEFHDPYGDFHQIDIYFRCTLQGSAKIDPAWQDAEAIVHDRRWVTRDELRTLPHKPDSLGAVAFDADTVISYDPLEPIVR